MHQRRWVIAAAVSAEQVFTMGDGTVVSGVVKTRLENLDDK